MLSITTKSPYALRALVELARLRGGGPVPIGELARRRDIPVQFLEQLFAVLRRAGILKSQRGVKGGYSFAREPSEITVIEIVELLDGPVGAGAEGLFADAAEAARNVLAGATMYYI
jgi:Rrf2 family protein